LGYSKSGRLMPGLDALIQRPAILKNLRFFGNGGDTHGHHCDDEGGRSRNFSK
jgi:hypothetical protein